MVLYRICSNALSRKERVTKKQAGMCKNCFFFIKIEVIGERAWRERVRQTQRGGVADGDMLIYEPHGFSLTILSLTKTEREKGRRTGRGKIGGP